MSQHDFLNGAPKFITSRFNSVNNYVWQTLFPEAVVKEQLKKRKTNIEKREEIVRLKSISDEASTLVFLFLINKFFVEGAMAAKQAVDTFKELNVDGFYIGSNYFSERNEKVIQGDIISKQLIASIKDDNIKGMIAKYSYVSEIIEEYKRFI